MGRSILIVEDDRDIAHLVALHLRELCAELVLSHDGLEAWAQAQARHFDLIILDLKLPGLDGLELCRRLRARPTYTPILMLTARSSEIDRIIGLELGADDYLTKPFSVLELAARVKAMFRRAEALSAQTAAGLPTRVQVGELSMDPERREVQVQGKPVELTAREFDLLLYFAHHPGRVYTRAQLLDQVWGYRHDSYEHTVNSHINRLRAKIERDPTQPAYILTVWGVGYKFADLSGASG